MFQKENSRAAFTILGSPYHRSWILGLLLQISTDRRWYLRSVAGRSIGQAFLRIPTGQGELLEFCNVTLLLYMKN
jgi:hypothetical protein